jgi:hypothetical protein
MDRKDKCKLAITKGYTYDPITGVVRNRLGKEITKKVNGYYLLLVLGMIDIY